MKLDDIQKRFFTFQGRLNRWAYFKDGLILFIAGCVLSIAVYGGFTTFDGQNLQTNIVGQAIQSIWAIISYAAGITLMTRRLHDLNKSGWWQLLFFVPIVFFIIAFFLLFLGIGLMNTENVNQLGMSSMIGGALVLLLALFISAGFQIYVLFWKGTTGPNDYGPDPLATLENNSISEEKFVSNTETTPEEKENEEKL